MKAALRLLVFISLCSNACVPWVGATPASIRVSTLELAGMELLYTIDDDQFDFNDAYLVDNSGSIPVGSFPRVGYYIELGNGVSTNWVWVSMDTFNPDPTLIGVPRAGTGIVENGTRVSNLNVESDHPNVIPGRGLEGIIEFWASNYGAGGGGLFGSDDARFDWKDSGGSTGGGHGSFQVFAFTNSGMTAAQTLFGITANGGAGIGDQPGHPPGNSPDWTFGPNTSTYTIRNLEIWIGDNRNVAPVINDLDGDAFTYTPGADGIVLIDQGTTATADDLPPIGINGWTNGTLRVRLAQGGSVADDALGIVNEGTAAGQIGVAGANVSFEGTVIGTFTGGTGGADLVVTFNGAATTPAVSALVDNFSFENTNAGTSPLSRSIEMTLTDGDGGSSPASTVLIIMDVGGTVVTYVWEGDESNLFNTPGNWDGGVVPDANDVAIFRDAGAGVVELGFGATVGEIRFDGASSYSLEDGVLTLKALTQASTATGINQIQSQLLSVGLAGSVEAGRLNLINNASTYSGVYVVSGGVLQANVFGASSSLGSAQVDLDGGELDLRGVEDFVPDALHHYGYQPTPNPTNNDLNLDMNGGLLGGSLDFGGDPTLGRGFTSRTLLTDGPAGRGLDFNGDGDFLATGVINQNDNYMNLFIGTLTVTAAEAGNWTFRRAQDDDTIGMWIDLDQDGIFESSQPGLGSNRGEQMQWDGFNQPVTNNLVAGDYLVAFTHREGNGGSQIEVLISNPNLAEEILKPTDPDQIGYFGVNQKSEGPIANTVRLLSSSKIISDAFIHLGQLEATASAQLMLDGVGVAFDNTILTGTLSVITTNEAPLELSAVSGPGGFTQEGNGVITLPTSNSYEGPTTINAGIVDLLQTGTLGSAIQGTVVNSNGSLRVAGGTHAEPLELHGVGNAESDGALSKYAGGNVFWNGTITVPVDARIYSEGNELFMDGGVALTGTNLTVDAQNRVNLRVNPLVGGSDATVRVEGNDRLDIEIANPDYLGDFEAFGDGRIDVHQSGGLGDGSGETRALGGNTTIVLRGNPRTHVENFVIEGDGRGIEGAIRIEDGNHVIDGTITLLGDSEIFTRLVNSSVEILGSIEGGYILGQRGPGLMILRQDNDLSGFNLIGGIVRISTSGGLGTTPNLPLETGEALEFDGIMTLDGTTLGGIGINGGTLTSFAGDTVLDVPVVVETTRSLNVTGDGNLTIVGAIGNGDVPLAAGALSLFGFHISNDNLAMNLHNNAGMVNGTPPDPAAASNLNFFGESLMSIGPGGRGLDFNLDADWHDAGVIETNVLNNYSSLFIGYLNVDAANAGDWAFRRVADDDRMGIWLDVNTNGVFESVPTGLGSDREEQLQWDNDGAAKVRTLAEGRYLFAVTHREGSGGSQVHVEFKSPTMSGLDTIKPAAIAQAGLWEPLSGTPPPIQPENGLTKSGDGVLTLLGDNTFNQSVVINGGLLVAAHDNALGTDSNILARAGSLGFYGDVTISDKTLTAGGIGANQLGTLVNVDGNNQFLGDIVGNDYVTLELGVAADAGSLTVGTPGTHVMELAGSKLLLAGAGDVVINSDISNVGGVLTADALVHYGYHINNDGLALDLDGNAGMMGGGDPTTFQNFFGQSYLINGPGGRGLDFDVDEDFIATGSIGQIDNYSNLWLAKFSCNETGTWGFRNAGDDDRAGIWFDLNQNGIFESTDAGLGSNRGEQLSWEDGGNKQISLTAGQQYLVAFTHREGGGGSRADFRFTPPGGTERIIKPGDAAQAGLWQTDLDARNNVMKMGTGTVTLSGDNTYAGPTTVMEGTLVVGSANALGSDADETTVQAGTLALASNLVYNTPEFIILNGVGATNQPGALVSLGGTTTIGSSVSLNATPLASVIGIGTEDGTFTIDTGALDLQNAALIVDGAGDTVINANIFGFGVGVAPLTYEQEVLLDTPVLYFQFEETVGTNVLNIGSVGTNFNGTVFDAAHTDLDVPGAFPALGSAAAFDDDPLTGITTPFSLNSFSNQFAIEAWVLSPLPQNGRSGVAGQNDSYEFGMADANNIELWNPAAAAFQTPYTSGEWFHLVATGDGSNRYIYINGVEVATDLDAAVDYGNSGFFFNIGGRGIQDGPGANNGNAFNGSIDEVALYGRSLSAADVLRHYTARANITPNNAVIKRGGGTLFLENGSQYNGGTRVEDGVLMANGFVATGTGPVTVVDGGVLAGLGQAGGDVTLAVRGELSPGVAAGTLGVGTDLVFTNLSAVYNAELGGTGVGQSDLVDVAGNIEINNATLDLTLLTGYSPVVSDTITILSANAGTISGTFNGLADGARVSAEGEEFIINYTTAAVTLTATGGKYVYAGPDTVNRPSGTAVTFNSAELTVNDALGAGGGPLVVTAVSPNGVDGGTVSLNAGMITYTPPVGYLGDDSFTYTVSDGVDTSVGLVTVRAVDATGGPAVGDVAGLLVLPSGDYRVAFAGTPDAAYEIQWTDSLLPPVAWNSLGTVQSDSSGDMTIDHPNPPEPVVYYRAVAQ